MKRLLLLFPFLLVSYEIATYLSNDMYLSALPSIEADFKTTTFLTQASLTTWFLGSASLQLFLGPLSDRYGRRPILLIGGFIFVLASIACALSTNITMLLIARFFEGWGVCSMIVAGYAAIHELYDQAAAIRTLALMGSITILAPALGPVVGAVILQISNSWQAIFWILAIWSSIALLGLLKWMPETNPAEKRHPTALPILLKNYGSLLKNNAFLLNLSSFCLFFGGMIAILSALPFLAITKFGYSPTMYGATQGFVFGGFILGSRSVKKGLEKLGIPKLIAKGLRIAFCGALFSALLFLILPAPYNFMCFILGLAVFAGGGAMTSSSLQRLAIDAATEPMGARMAILSSFISWFGVLASFLISLLNQHGPLMLSGLLILASGLAIFLQWQLRKHKA